MDATFANNSLQSSLQGMNLNTKEAKLQKELHNKAA